MNDPASNPDLVEVGHYLRADQAEDRALVALAAGAAYWIVPQEGLFALYVKRKDAEAVARELATFEAERREQRKRDWEQEAALHEPARRRVSPVSLFVYAWVLGVFFLLQLHGPHGWEGRGMADSQAILRGEWWRVITALTLHADLAHLLANLAVGLLFAHALLPYFGVGWTWLGIVTSGAVGNALNAWGYRDTAHLSLGASTGVFGGLGMLVGYQLCVALRNRRAPLREVLFPLGAGLALLAYLGSGNGEDGKNRVDTMAHLFGMLAGIGIGGVLTWLQLRTTALWQRIAASVALALPVLAWLVAYTR